MSGEMRGCICAAFVALAISTVGTDSASALCVDFPFEEQIRSADIIFVGTVHRLETAWTANHWTIVTRYEFGEVRYIKGAGPATGLVLVQEGGRVGNEGISRSLSVEFREGRRYAVFAYVGMGHHVPQLCGWSPFGIWPDSGSATPVVHLGSGGPILALRMRHIVALGDRPWEAAYPPGGEHPVRPGRQSLFEVLRSADAEAEATSLQWNFKTEPERQRYLDRMKRVPLWPHQDLGTRVTEPDFIAWLERICAEQSSMPADSMQSR